MARLEALSNVGVFTRNLKKAKEFYVRKVGLKVREQYPKWGYLALGPTKKGKDADLNIWQPTKEMWGKDYEEAIGQVGQVTGVGFRTGNIDKTVETLRARNVKVDWMGDEGEGRMASILDPDGNSFFVSGPSKSGGRKPGLASLDFVTIVTKDSKKAGEFFTKKLGMRRGDSFGEGLVDYRLNPRGTAIVPFKPTKDMYENVAEYAEDLAHIGENTSIMFETKHIRDVQKTLLSKGVKFGRKAEHASWGGMEAEFYDLDKNIYTIMQPSSVTKREG